jgi:hypothetical protein
MIANLTPWSRVLLGKSLRYSRIVWNLKVRHRVYKSLPLVPVPNQMNPVYTTQSYFCKMHVRFIPHLRLVLPSYLLPSGFSTKILYASHLPWLHHSNCILRRVYVMKLSRHITQISRVTVVWNDCRSRRVATLLTVSVVLLNVVQRYIVISGLSNQCEDHRNTAVKWLWECTNTSPSDQSSFNGSLVHHIHQLIKLYINKGDRMWLYRWFTYWMAVNNDSVERINGTV